MGTQQKSIVVLCRHAGVLLNYGVLLNQLGYFNVSLCSSMKDVSTALSARGGADCLLLDDFKAGSVDEFHIRSLNYGCLVQGFLLVGDFLYDGRYRVFEWARAHHISQLGMIKNPVCSVELKRYLDTFAS